MTHINASPISSITSLKRNIIALRKFLVNQIWALFVWSFEGFLNRFVWKISSLISSLCVYIYTHRREFITTSTKWRRRQNVSLMCERKSTTALNKKWMQWKKRKAFWRWFWRDSRTRKRYVFYVTRRAFVRALRDENTKNFARWDRVSLCFSFRCSLLLVAREGFAYKVGFETYLMMNFSL